MKEVTKYPSLQNKTILVTGGASGISAHNYVVDSGIMV